MTGVLLAGGGTAGHVNPLLATADELRSRHPDLALRVLGTREGLEADLVPARGFDLSFVPRVPLPRRPSTAYLSLPGRLRAAVRAAGEAIDEVGASVVVGFGGYVSTPAYLAARRRGVPIVIHEQNTRPGLANRLGARWAAATAVTFAGTPLRGATVTGLPMRREVETLARGRGDLQVRADARRALGLDPSRAVLLVTGGSLGAQRVNEALTGAAADVLAHAQVLHLTGRGKSGPVLAAVDLLSPALRAGYHVREYLDEMQLAYAAADLVVCRAGAGTVCELAAVGLPAVYVPLPIGNGEQARNASGVIEAGGGLLVRDADLDAALVRREVVPLLAAPDRLASMGRAAAGVGVADGAARLVDLVDTVRRGPGAAA